VLKPTTHQARIGLYPGTFDPITLGHGDVISRAVRVVDRLYIGVAKSSGKGPLFDYKARARQVEREIAPLRQQGADIVVYPFEGLLMDVAISLKAQLIIRGLRAVSDFEYEFQMAGMNYRLNNTVETVFLMASERHQFISSRFVKEIARLGGDVSPFVSAPIVKDLQRRFANESGRRKVAPEVRD
jgi:pantetheine-phosphate adenylyltransferase